MLNVKSGDECSVTAFRICTYFAMLFKECCVYIAFPLDISTGKRALYYLDKSAISRSTATIP